MGFFDSVGKGLKIGSAVSSFFGGDDEGDAAKDAAKRQAKELKRVAKANKEISLRDAAVARRIGMTQRLELDAKAGLMYKNMNRLLAQQRTRYAKSGVAISRGTPVDVMEQTVIEVGNDIHNIKYKGQSARARAESLAQRYELLTEHGMKDAAAQASLIKEAASDMADVYSWKKWGQAASDVYSLGQEFGWF